MRYAIFSDLHDDYPALDAVMMDSKEQQVEQWVYLGDVGREWILFHKLYHLKIPCVYGNWEVSGLRRPPAQLETWLAEWPNVIRFGDAICCHATPDQPLGVETTARAAEYVRTHRGRANLFPRLHNDEDARWRAFATLEAHDLRVAFHGHTHIQMGWAWESNPESDTPNKRRLRSFTQVGEHLLLPGLSSTPNRYIIGVGSAGDPQDGRNPRYVIYDEREMKVIFRKI